jgi:hypothetical protein
MLVERGIVDEHTAARRVNLPFAGFLGGWPAWSVAHPFQLSLLSTMGESAAVSLYCKPFLLLCCSAVMLLTDVRRHLFDK